MGKIMGEYLCIVVTRKYFLRVTRFQMSLSTCGGNRLMILNDFEKCVNEISSRFFRNLVLCRFCVIPGCATSNVVLMYLSNESRSIHFNCNVCHKGNC